MSLERYTKPDLGIIQVLWGIGFHNEATCTLLVEQTLDFSPNDLSLFHQIMLSLGSVAPVITVSMYHYEMGNYTHKRRFLLMLAAYKELSCLYSGGRCSLMIR